MPPDLIVFPPHPAADARTLGTDSSEGQQKQEKSQNEGQEIPLQAREVGARSEEVSDLDVGPKGEVPGFQEGTGVTA